MDNTTRFGNLREAYAKGRRRYPSECIDYIASLARKGTRVLDLGCGTGIATRQLVTANLDVVGADSDEEMLEKAREHKKPKIIYIVGRADNLPFDDNSFGMITAFGAFHWFCDKSSIAGIKKALRPEGTFVAINKNDNDRFRRAYRTILREFAEIPPSVKRGYNPRLILQRSDFYGVTRKVFPVKEIFSIDEAITHVQSRGNWNHIPRKSYSEAIQKLRDGFERLATDGKIQRQIEIAVINGRK